MYDNDLSRLIVYPTGLTLLFFVNFTPLDNLNEWITNKKSDYPTG